MRAAHRFALFLTLAAGAAAAIAQARAGGGDDQGEDPGPLFRADLSGYHEVLNPAGGGAVSTPARGTFRARLAQGGKAIEYELSYRDLLGDVTQSHIHFGQRGTTGGIMVWLCQTPPDFTDPTGKAPTCPEEGTVRGEITAANIIGGAATQGIAEGEFEEAVRAIRAGAAYVNVHSTSFPPGEIRGQVKSGG